jgi:hypothetical protein
MKTNRREFIKKAGLATVCVCTGVVIKGPAKNPLETYSLLHNANRITVDLST